MKRYDHIINLEPETELRKDYLFLEQKKNTL